MTVSFGAAGLRWGPRAAALCLATAATTPAWAATEVQVWQALNGHNQDALHDQVKSFNRSQSDVKVVLKNYFTTDVLLQALDDAAKNKTTLPALAQLGDHQTADEIAKRAYIQPFYTLQNRAGLRDIKWFVSSDNAFVHDARGRLLAFPYMLEVPVMYYNRAAFTKAGLKPAAPERPWLELQSQLVSLANDAGYQCPLTTDLPVSINLENLAAVNKQFYASADNGLKAKGLPSFSFDSTYVRHLSLMISWVRSRIMADPNAGAQSVDRFVKGECGVLLSNSGHIGEFNDTRLLDYAVAGLPYYPEVTHGAPGNPFIGGGGLWVIKQTPETTKATTQFLAWLAQPEQAATWYQETGYLPLTHAAFERTPKRYFDDLGQWHDLVAVYAKPSAVTAKGFNVRNYSAIHARFQEIIDNALSGHAPAVTALSMAAAEANKLVRQ